MSIVVNKKPASYWIHAVISVAIMLCFGFIPPLGGDITPFGMKVLGIFVGTFYGWIFVDFFWTSLLGVILLGLTSYGTIPEVFTEGISNTMTLNMLLMFAFCAFLEKTGLLNWITYWLISRKILIGHPWRFTAMFLFTIIPISLIGGIYAGIVLLWKIFGNVCDLTGYTKEDLYTTYVISGIASLGGIVSICFPFQPFTQLCFGLAAGAAGISEFPVLQWSSMGVVNIVVMFVAYLFLGKFILRVDVSKLNNMGDAMGQYRNQKMDSDQRFGMILLLIFLVLIILPSVITGPVQVFCNKFSILGACCLCIVAAYIYQEWRGTKLYTFGNMVTDGVSWELMMLFIVTFPLCTAMESAEAGVISTVVATLMPIVNKISPIVFLILITVIFCAITQVAHNLVLIIALVPPLTKICVGVGIDPIMFGYIFCVAMLNSSATPAASAQSAMVFGQTQWVKRSYGFLVGTANYLFMLLCIICIMLPIGMLIF